MGGQFAGNMANTLLAGAGGSGHAEGTSQAAVAEGTIVIRDRASQQQDVGDLSRDTEHANDSISPIFNKEKEQKRLQTAQLVGEISGQMASIVNTVGDIKAMEAANEKMGPVPEGLSEKDRAAEVEKRRSSDYYQTAIRDYGIGSKNQMVVQAITGVLQGLVSGNITQAVAGGVSPLMAQTIKAYTTNPDGTTNTAANLMAHAVWGAVAAQMSGGNAAAGAGGAFSAELAARYITENYYNAKTPEEISKLSESDRQEISLLSTLAAGAAGGVVGDSTAAVTTGAQTGKNAVENNYLSVQEADRKAVLERKEKAGTITGDEKQELAGINQTDKARNQAITAACTDGNKGGLACGALIAPAQEALNKYGEKVTYSLIYKDLYPQDAKNLESVLQGLDAESISRDQAITAIANESGKSWNEVAKQYDSAMQVQSIAIALAGMKGIQLESNITKAPVIKPNGNTAPSFDANEIRFSQSTVSSNKTDRDTRVKYTYDDLVSSMKKDGWKGDPVDVVKMPDGNMTSMDNTRISAARESGVKVEANIRNYNEKLTPSEAERFSDRKRGFIPQTWGEAITGRINKQSGGFSTENPYGSNELPRITGRGK